MTFIMSCTKVDGFGVASRIQPDCRVRGDVSELGAGHRPVQFGFIRQTHVLDLDG
jgi:hypothetical protein